MGFLDNLENDLKALEDREERDPVKIQRERERRDEDKKAALLRAPYAEILKTSAFTMDLLTHCRAIGHERRTLVRFTWLGDTLRLDAGEARMELAPEAEGIQAVCFLNGEEVRRMIVDPKTDDPAILAKTWLAP